MMFSDSNGIFEVLRVGLAAREPGDTADQGASTLPLVTRGETATGDQRRNREGLHAHMRKSRTLPAPTAATAGRSRERHAAEQHNGTARDGYSARAIVGVTER